MKIDTNISLNRKTELVDQIERYMGYDFLHIWNANINGYIIQLRTNNTTLEDFWRESWYPASLLDDIRPHATIFVISNMHDTEETVAYHSDTRTAIMINIDSYDVLRSLTLGIVWDVSENRKRLHFIRGALVDVNGEGFVLTGDPYDEITTHMFSLLELEQARIHSHELIFVEHLGGIKGRMSTHASERKFYLNQEIASINAKAKSLLEKCKKDGKNFILDPWWIGGHEKYIDTTRIKAMFVLNKNSKQKEIIERVTPDRALELFMNAVPPYYNSHHLINDAERLELMRDFFKEIFEFVAVYEINPHFSILEKQKAIRKIILKKEYTSPLTITQEQLPAFDFESILKNVDMNKIKDAVVGMQHQSNVEQAPVDELRRRAEMYGTRTKFGNYNFVSTVKNRSAELTVYVGSKKVQQENLSLRQRELLKNVPKTMQNVLEYLKKGIFVHTKRRMGDNDEFTPICNLFVSTHRKEMVRLAHMVNQTFFDVDTDHDPQLYIVFIPEWQEKDRQILVFPEVGITFVLGSDYYGEAKKGFLRMAMWAAKERGLLGLHAGAKIIKAQDKKSGKIKKYATIIFGLTATGKTTHSCHTHGLTQKGEGIEIVQDDFIAIKSDGDGLSDGDEVLIYGTDPKNPDTDGDGISDYDEIFIYGSDPLDKYDPYSQEENITMYLLIVIIIACATSAVAGVIKAKKINRPDKEIKNEEMGEDELSKFKADLDSITKSAEVKEDAVAPTDVITNTDATTDKKE